MSFLAVAVAAFQAGAGAPAAPQAGLPQFDPTSFPSQVFWLAIFFGGLYWLMASYFLPRVGAMIEERRDRIADDLDQAAEFREQASSAERTYEKALADATARARAIAAETRAKIAEEIVELSAEADKKASEAIAAAEGRIAAMKADAAEKVREAAADTARAIVAALIDETPTAESVAAAMSERIDA